MDTTRLRLVRAGGRAHRRLQEFRTGRDAANEDHIDWFLDEWRGLPCNGLLDHEDRCPLCIEEARASNAYNFAVGFVDQAIESLLDPAFELQARVRPQDRLGQLARGALAPWDAAVTLAADPWVEQRVFDWTDALGRDDLARDALADSAQVQRDPVEFAALRALWPRTRPQDPKHHGFDGPALGAHVEWLRCVQLVVLAYPLWVRPLSDWRGSTPRSLIDHVLCRYPVGDWLYRWFLTEEAHSYPRAVHAGMARIWLVAVAQGVGVKKALVRLGWSLPDGVIDAIPKVLSHPYWRPGLSAVDVVSDAVVLRMAGADAACFTAALDAGLHWRPDLHTVEPSPHWCASRMLPAALQWMLRHRQALTEQQAIDVLRWAMHRDREAWRRVAPAFSWRGRTAGSAARAAERHLVQIRRLERAHWRTWAAKGWDWQCTDAEHPERVWQMAELLGTGELVAEGECQGHCVAGYATRCVEGHSAIFGLSLCGRRQLTIEVAMAPRKVVQVRGQFNRSATSEQADMVRLWAREFGIAVGVDVW